MSNSLKPDSQLPKSDELYLKIVETSQNEKEDNLQEPTVQESLLNVKNEQNASILSKKGVFRQILLTGAVLIMAAAGGMPIGFSPVILPQLHINSTEHLRMDLEMGSWFASVHSLSSPIGSFISGPIMDRFGRRTGVMVSAVPLVLGWCLIALAPTHLILITGRFLAGLSVGLMSAPSQILLSECAQPKIRGFLNGVPFVTYAIGILITFVLGLYLHWRMAAWFCNILPIAAVVALYFVPESPVWLVRMGYLSRAEKSLNWLRCNDTVAKAELQELVRRCENENVKSENNLSVLQALRKPHVLKPFLIINIFNALMILSGTYLIVFYAVDILSEFGTEVDSMTAAVYSAVTRVIFTICTCFLVYHLNRRTLSVWSGFGSGLSTSLLAIFTYIRLGQPKSTVDTVVPAICIFCYIAANTNLMILPGVMVGELLPAQIRGRVAGLVYTWYNFFFFIVTKTFPAVSNRLKSHGVFMLFGLASFGASIFAYLFLPETKENTLGEIEDYFGEKNWFWIGRNKSRKTDLDEKNSLGA